MKTSTHKSFLLLLLLMISSLMCSVAKGQSLPKSKPAKNPLITLRFPEKLELKIFVDYVSKRAGINILYDEKLGRRLITIKAPSQVPLSSLLGILNSALKMNNLALIDDEQRGWKRIVQADKLVAIAPPISQTGRTQLVMTRIYKLQHADLTQAAKVIKPFLTQPGGNSFDLSEQKLLIVTDYAANIQRITDLIKLVDQPKEAILVKFLSIKHIEASKIKAKVKEVLSTKQAARGSDIKLLKQVAILGDDRINQLIIIGTTEQVAEVEKFVHSFDVPLGLITKVYQFQSASPKRIDMLTKKLIGDLTIKRVYRSVIDTEAGMLIVTGTRQIHQQVESLKEQLDKPVPEDQSPIRFYKLANATASDVLATIRQIEGGENLSFVRIDNLLGQARKKHLGSGENLPPPGPGKSLPKPPSYTPSMETGALKSNAELAPVRKGIETKQARVVADVNTNTIIVVAPPAVQRIYEKLIAILDRRRPQVLIECTIVTLDTSDGFSLGVDISASGTPTSGKIDQWMTFGQFGLNSVDASTGRLTLTPSIGFNGAILSASIVDIIIHALETSGRAKVISAPRILVNDNSSGSLASIAEQPYTSVNASDTVATTSFAGYASAGTTIDVTPHIAEGNHLQLEYSITLNSFTGQSENGIPPPRSTNTLASKITIPDGHTIIVGGLNRQDTSETASSLPGMSKIPLLQFFPGIKTKNKGNSTLFVFIRPIILRDDRFRDLKYLSEKDMELAGLPSDMPTSAPVVME